MEPAKEKVTARNIRKLLFNARWPVRMVSIITLYRIVTFPLLIVLIFFQAWDIFKWFLLASFLTDAVDGFLARKYNAASVLGAKLDSIGDDLTVLAAIVGLCVGHFDFILEQAIILSVLIGLFIIQLVAALVRYGKISSFHTYMAKIAAVATAVFLLSVFFLDRIPHPLFYMALILTAADLIEEIILVFMLPEWKANVRGIYFVLKNKGKLSDS